MFAAGIDLYLGVCVQREFRCVSSLFSEMLCDLYCLAYAEYLLKQTA